MKSFYNLFRIFAALFLSLGLGSCASVSDMEVPADGVGQLNVSGIVYDFNTAAGVKGIEVTLSVFDKEDINFRYPLQSVNTVSGEDGSYSLSASLKDDCRYRLSAKDVDEAENGLYGPQSTADLSLDFSSQGYDSSTDSYVLNYDIAIYPVM